ncbi:MAG: hypothetical protein MJZ57_01170 [Bacteroidales bacterium]|nr:hypothetical protein [Bacteroidales bacterium]
MQKYILFENFFQPSQVELQCSGGCDVGGMASWPAGVYLLNITNAQGQKVQKKVVKVL